MDRKNTETELGPKEEIKEEKLTDDKHVQLSELDAASILPKQLEQLQTHLNLLYIEMLLTKTASVDQ